MAVATARCRRRAAALRAPAVAARPRRFVAQHRRRSRGVHPLRPLRARLRRGQEEQRHRPDRQGLHDAASPSTSNTPMGSSTCVSCGECMVSCPTGALTNKRVVATELGGGETLDAEWILQLPVFKGVSGTFLELNKGAVVQRASSRPGEVICREGEFGSTAFYILEGTVDVFIGTPIAHVKQEDARADGWFARSAACSRTASEHTRDGGDRAALDSRSTRRSICRTTTRSRELGAGDLFGEMTCMSFHPRSATVRAATRRWSSSRCCATCSTSCRRTRRSARELDRKYRAARARNAPAQRPGASRRCRRTSSTTCAIASSCSAIRPGEVIVRQGDAADAFYLVRLGFVKVSRAASGRRARAHVSRAGRVSSARWACSAAASARPPARRSITWTWSGSAATTSR